MTERCPCCGQDTDGLRSEIMDCLFKHEDLESVSINPYGFMHLRLNTNIINSDSVRRINNKGWNIVQVEFHNNGMLLILENTKQETKA